MKRIAKSMMMALAVSVASSAGAAYKCVDEKGITHIGDTPPDPCANVVMYEVHKSGLVLRKIDPTPTPEQLKARQLEQEKLKEAEKAAAEQKRKDLALLSSYSNEREFDVSRDRNVEPLTGRIRNSQDRIKAVEKRIKELEDESEFYKAGKSSKAGSKTREAPPVLVHELQRLRTEKESLEKSIANNEREIEQIKVKFAGDKKRWTDLKADPTMRNQQPEAPKAAITMIPGAAGTARCADKVYECQAGTAYMCRSMKGNYRVDCVVERK